MEVMTQGFELVREIKVGELEARRSLDAARQGAAADGHAGEHRGQRGLRHRAAARFRRRQGQPSATPLTRVADVRRDVPGEARLQPAGQRRTRRSASWPPAAATPRRSTSRAARRRSTSPRTARSAWSASRSVRTRRCPNCSQDLDTILRTAVTNYVTDARRAAEDAAAAAGDRASGRAS